MANAEHSLSGLPGFRMAAAGFNRPDQSRGVPRSAQGERSADRTPSVEERHTWEVTPMTQSHLQGVVNLFRDYERPVETPDGAVDSDSLHVHHENLTLYTPRNWRDQASVARFKRIARKFYFPDGQFVVTAPKTGSPVTVERTSWIAMRDRKIVGVYSVLSDDPYAPDSDRVRAEKAADPEKPNEHSLRMAYGHVLLVTHSARRMEVGSYLVAKSNDQLFKWWDQVTECVDQAGNWSAGVDFFHSVGFEDDRRKKSEYEYPDGDGRIINGRRLIETAEGWRKKRSQVYTKIGERWNIDPEQLKAT